MHKALYALVLMCGCAPHSTIDESKVVDLTYAFNDQTIYWPTARRFELHRVSFGYGDDGRWYASNDFCASEHGGTHLDAPVHFAPQGSASADIPLSRLIGPVRVIDVRSACGRDRDYLLCARDVEEHEARYGDIRPGTAVLVLTGFGRHYPDARLYLGSDVRGTAEGLSFPGIGPDAARLLVERRIDLVGLDTASLDHGPSTDFAAHRIFGAADVPGLENVANLEKLPPTGATLVALPVKIDGGTGGPCRIIAILP